jgi:CRP-like cAMP-binding protein
MAARIKSQQPKLRVRTESLPELEKPSHRKRKLPGISLHSPETSMTSLSQHVSLSDFPSLYPSWLVSRKDFQDLRLQYERLDRIDVFAACQKSYLLRSDFEKKAVIKMLKACAFFGSMKEHQLGEIADRMVSKEFETGMLLMKKNERADCMYLLLHGRVGIYLDENGLAKDEVIEGNVIGEAAVQGKNHRTATVKAIVPVKALRLTYEDYDLVVYRLKLQDFYDVATFLRSIEYFSMWNISKLYRLASVIIVKHFKAGQHIYNIGEMAHDLYIVREGVVSLRVEVKVEKSNRWPTKAHEWTRVQMTHKYEKSLKNCEVGMFFGEHDLITRTCHNTNAICASESCLLFIIIEDFFREIFSDKDCKALDEISLMRPNTRHLREELEREKRLIHVSSEAMLNAFDINNLPIGRGLFLTQRDIRKAKWAQRIVRKKQGDMRRDLVTLQKEETHMGFDEPLFRTFHEG